MVENRTYIPQKKIYNRAKKFITRLVHGTKTSYFCSMNRDSLSCKQLFRITNQLLRGKNSHCPQLFEFFHIKVQTIRNNLDCQASLPPRCTKPCFHGRTLRNFEHVTEALVKGTILNSTAKTCDFYAFLLTCYLNT